MVKYYIIFLSQQQDINNKGDYNDNLDKANINVSKLYVLLFYSITLSILYR